MENGGGSPAGATKLSSSAFFPSFSEIETIPPGLDNVRPVGDPVQQRLAQSRIREHRRPFRERQVGRHKHDLPLGSFGNHLEQKLGSDFGQEYTTDLVERDHVVAEPSRQHALDCIVLLGLHQFVHQIRHRR
jgi:hypothetical protein